jgi:LysR family glycine cleavage system transcriptional activator
MPRALPPLNALRAFEAAARLGSFTRAARELHVTPAAISHQVRGLEEYLGVRLFRRTKRKLLLSEQAVLASACLRQGFEQIGQGVGMLRAGEKSSLLSLSATPAFATRWLVGRLPRFEKAHPRVRLRIASTTAPVDFEQDDIDVAIRLGRGGFDGVSATELFPEWIAPVAAPTLLRKYPCRRPVDLLKAPLIHDDSLRKSGRALGWQEWIKAAKITAAHLPMATHYDDGHLSLQAAAAGSGIALGRLVYAATDLSEKTLRIPFRPVLKLDVSYQLLVPDTKASLPAVEAFREWILAEAEQFREEIRRWVGGPDAR